MAICIFLNVSAYFSKRLFRPFFISYFLLNSRFI